MGVIWGSFGHHLGVIRGSFGHHLGVIWDSIGGHLGVIWASFGRHLGIIRESFGGHLGVIWESFWSFKLVWSGPGREKQSVFRKPVRSGPAFFENPGRVSKTGPGPKNRSGPVFPIPVNSNLKVQGLEYADAGVEKFCKITKI